ncbi:MAG: Verru_Chthon cassette protein A, partial [Verrucomicrobiota bacterium]
MVGAGNLSFSDDLPKSADETAITTGNHSIFTDLNSPVVDGGNQTVFPIADPAALNAVEGFTATSNASIGVTVTGSSANPNDPNRRLPMPARWLYMLKDGTLAPATATANANTATVTGATASNPIVGRVAFWTDDETSKVNINTASEGTYWDTPRLSFKEDWDFANFQPAQKEFQRYPGHPAMTSLAPVFFATSTTNTSTTNATQRNALYSVTPRIVGGGSNAGTVIANSTLTPDSDRLYASVDELMFTANRTTQSSSANITANSTRQRAFFLTASSRAPEVTIFNTPRVSMWPIYKVSAGGTLSSNRTTAFDKLIAFCSTINKKPYYFQREDSKSPTNDWANIERNREVLRYLQTLSGKAVPGFGASLVSKTTTADRDQLLVSMLDYIRSANLYDDNLSPNTYASQADADNAVQFTTGRKPVTDLLQYAWSGHGVVAPLRVPANLSDGTSSSNTTLMGFGRFATISEAGLLFICNADGKNGTLKTPLKDDGTPLPPGETPSADQLARMMSNVVPGTDSANRTFGFFLDQSKPGDNLTLAPTVTVSAGNTTYQENRMLSATLTPNERRVQMMLFFDYFSPMHGWTQFSWDGSLDVEVTGSFKIAGQSVSFASPVETVNFDGPQGSWGFTRSVGGLGYRRAFTTESGSRLAPGEAGLTVLRRYGLVTTPFTVPVAAGTMDFKSPDKLLVKFYSRPTTPTSRARTPADLVQTIELKFPDAKFPIPVLA